MAAVTFIPEAIIEGAAGLGNGQEKVLDAAEICGGVDKVVKVEAQHTFINGLLGLITLGIYTPRDAKVYCKA